MGHAKGCFLISVVLKPHALSGSETDLDLYGGKACGLAAIWRAGRRIPRTWVIPSTVFAAFCAAGQPFDHVRRAEFAAQIGAASLDFAASSDLAELLECAGGGLIVRSSASVEDGCSHSFAGLLRTIPGAYDRRSLVAHVRSCWQSLFCDPAADRFMKMGMAAPPTLSIIIQEQVPCEKAGVCFTMDPITGRRDRVVIEACWGLCSSVVSGRQDADRYVLDAEGGCLSHSLGAKPIYDVFSRQGTTTLPTPPDLASTSCLSDDELRAVAEAAAAMQETLGRPVDIEWGLCDGMLYLLQCRPITTC